MVQVQRANFALQQQQRQAKVQTGNMASIVPMNIIFL
jgi:hypothetical protein